MRRNNQASRFLGPDFISRFYFDLQQAHFVNFSKKIAVIAQR